MWEGHEFSDQELEFWSEEIVAAAQELEEPRRAAFVAAACDGSEPLRRRVESLSNHAWFDETPRVFSGACQPGEIVCGCFILRAVGRGGTGEVYRAIQRSLRRIVALKVVTAPVHGVPTLAREAATVARLRHPNIVAVYHADLQGERPCIVMEYVDGSSLRQLLERYSRQRPYRAEPGLVRSIGRQVALALGEAHRQGLIHGDIKPENILLEKRGEDYVVKVADFGVARRLDTPAGPLVGTPGYVAPEQLQGAVADTRGDLFALGTTLYELLTGAHPFAAASDAETHFKTLSTEPAYPPDAADVALWRVVRRLLHKVPDERHPTGEAVVHELDRPEADASEMTASPLLSELPAFVQRWWERHRSGFLVAAASFLWGCVSVLLSIGAGAACIRVFWGGSAAADEHEVVYGYVVEPNAGLWYVLGASLCFLTGFGFLEAAQRGLARTRILVAGASDTPDPPRALQAIAAQNRRWFRPATPVIAVLATAFVVVPEVVFRRDHAFGWVQADLAAEQVGKNYETLREAGKVGDVPGLKTPCEQCEVRVRRVVNRSNGFLIRTGVFRTFLLSALGHQIVLVAFLMWIVAKMLFFFGLLSTALLSDSKDGLRLTPDFDDTDDYRFGLGRLDNVYYAILALVAVAAIGLFLQVIANVAKGTYYFAGDPSPALFGQAVLLLGTLSLLAVLLLAPAFIFLLLTVKAVDAELGRLSDQRKRLEAEMASARAAEDHERFRRALERVRERRTVARQQRLLPLKQPGFVGLLAAVLIMLLGFSASIGLLGRDTNSNRGVIAPGLVNAVCAACGNPRAVR